MVISFHDFVCIKNDNGLANIVQQKDTLIDFDGNNLFLYWNLIGTKFTKPTYEST